MFPSTLLPTRRDWFSWAGTGIGGVALAHLLQRDAIVQAARVPGEAADAPPHFKAKRVVHICLCGGLSHLDSFDYKPDLAKFHGKKQPLLVARLPRRRCKR